MRTGVASTEQRTTCTQVCTKLEKTRSKVARETGAPPPPAATARAHEAPALTDSTRSDRASAQCRWMERNASLIFTRAMRAVRELTSRCGVDATHQPHAVRYLPLGSAQRSQCAREEAQHADRDDPERSILRLSAWTRDFPRRGAEQAEARCQHGNRSRRRKEVGRMGGVRGQGVARGGVSPSSEARCAVSQ